MKTITQERPQAARTAASSPEAVDQAAADQKVLANLSPEDRELVEQGMANHPGLSAAKALEMLIAFGM
jgi:hypothetical protein